MSERLTAGDENAQYWNDERVLGAVFFGHDLRPVIARSHIAEERFRGRGSETLFTLTEREGQRTYVQTRFVTQKPQLPATPIGDAQAWYYPADRTIVLWEVLAAPPFQTDDPREGLFYRSLWRLYEDFLTRRFAGADTLLTTWEDVYDRGVWRSFLQALGYHQTQPAVFLKRLDAAR